MQHPIVAAMCGLAPSAANAQSLEISQWKVWTDGNGVLEIAPFAQHHAPTERYEPTTLPVVQHNYKQQSIRLMKSNLDKRAEFTWKIPAPEAHARMYNVEQSATLPYDETYYLWDPLFYYRYVKTAGSIHVDEAYCHVYCTFRRLLGLPAIPPPLYFKDVADATFALKGTKNNVVEEVIKRAKKRLADFDKMDKIDYIKRLTLPPSTE